MFSKGAVFLGVRIHFHAVLACFRGRFGRYHGMVDCIMKVGVSTTHSMVLFLVWLVSHPPLSRLSPSADRKKCEGLTNETWLDDVWWSLPSATYSIFRQFLLCFIVPDCRPHHPEICRWLELRGSEREQLSFDSAEGSRCWDQDRVDLAWGFGRGLYLHWSGRWGGSELICNYSWNRHHFICAYWQDLRIS